MNRLFVYGTLKSKEVQKKLLGHTLDSYKATLYGYSINKAEEYYNAVKSNGSFIKGEVLLVSSEDSLRIDQWEEVPLYLKEKVTVQTTSGREVAYIYLKKDKEDSIELVNNAITLSNSDDLDLSVTDFIKNRDTSYPVSDVYLQYKIKATGKFSNKDLIADKINSFTGEDNTYYLGKAIIEDYTINLYVTLDSDENGVLTIAMPVCYFNLYELWDKAFNNNLRLDNDVLDIYLKHINGIELFSLPRIFIFSCKDFTEAQRTKLFSVNASKKISSKNLIGDVDNSNIMTNVPKEFKTCYLDRLEQQLPFIFS